MSHTFCSLSFSCFGKRFIFCLFQNLTASVMCSSLPITYKFLLLTHQLLIIVYNTCLQLSCSLLLDWGETYSWTVVPFLHQYFLQIHLAFSHPTRSNSSEFPSYIVVYKCLHEGFAYKTVPDNAKNEHLHASQTDKVSFALNDQTSWPVCSSGEPKANTYISHLPTRNPHLETLGYAESEDTQNCSARWAGKVQGKAETFTACAESKL